MGVGVGVGGLVQLVCGVVVFCFLFFVIAGRANTLDICTCNFIILSCWFAKIEREYT